MTITAFPTPPSRQDPANFPARGDAFFGAFPQFVTEANALQSDVNAKQALVASDYLAAMNAGLPSAASNAAIASAKALEAFNQASLAAGYAASASSVVQQDLSAVTAQALHRSPNAVTALFIYDTSKDSDGGAWTDRCQHTSWYNEPLAGKWLGAQAGEAAARAVSGATTGDYFQLSTDGKFYKLNATSGTTEVFRGNTTRFPRLSAIVAESASITIYDLTQPGRPMWMRCMVNSMTPIYSNASVNGVVAGQGVMHVAAGEAISHASFISDTITFRTRFAFYSGTANLAMRHGSRMTILSNIDQSPGLTLVSGATLVNSVAMAVLPDAPVDVNTRIAVATVAVMTVNGVSVIRHDGTVSSHAFAALASDSVVLRGDFLYYTNGAAYHGWRYQDVSNLAGLTFSGVILYSGGYSYVGQASGVSTGRNRVIGRTGGSLPGLPGGSAVTPLILNKDSTIPVAVARITDRFNTGYMTGDIRRAYLSDSNVGSFGPSAELVTNGTFDFNSVGWSAANNSTLSVLSGVMRVTATGANPSATCNVTTVVGKTYVAKVRLVTPTPGKNVFMFVPGDAVTAGTTAGTYQVVFTATASTSSINIQGSSAAVAGEYFDVDDISVKESIADRSYKAACSNLIGSLTKTAVASGAQLVAYSGFSASNYLQESYSADLDFGTGEWSCSTWVNIPTGNAAAGLIASRAFSSGAYLTLGIDATNRLVATSYDGTTTRTVTSVASYAATWTKVEVCYTRDGALSIRVNGIEVAATRGQPLLTLNNAAAVLTIGNSFALTAPFPGSIALLKLSATAPTAEQSVWMYEQEKQLFRDGAQCLLPDSSTVVDLTYDDATDRWVAVSASTESSWSGLVRVATAPASAGSITKVAAASGVKLLARSTSSPGVDVTIPAYGLREELVRRAEAAARLAQPTTVFDFAGGFTATTVSGSTAITSVSGLSYPSQVNLVGARISGAGIPANTVIVAISGTTAYLSAPATATASAVQIGLTDFPLPVGYEARAVLAAGALKQEGATKDYTRLFDGFRETVRFGTAPGYAAFVQIQAVRSIL